MINKLIQLWVTTTVKMDLLQQTYLYAAGAFMGSFLVSCLLIWLFINTLSAIFGSKVRTWTPSSHQAKNNTPTMGGLYVLMAITLNVLWWCGTTQPIVRLFLVCLWSFGIIGALDDWCKIKSKRGISALLKFILQCGCAVYIAHTMVTQLGVAPTIVPPFLKLPIINLDINYFIAWAAFILVATSNAVNLTDGLDGLAAGTLLSNFSTAAIFCYLAGHSAIADYLYLPFVDSSEMAIAGAACMGAILGFLWFNTYPAQVFMGDVGSLSLGAILAFLMLIAKVELLLPIIGAIFVLETLSVILQVIAVRIFGKRLFRMAPLHHHFELAGWHESKITARFCIITLLLCLCALASLKLR